LAEAERNSEGEREEDDGDTRCDSRGRLLPSGLPTWDGELLGHGQGHMDYQGDFAFVATVDLFLQHFGFSSINILR
jgi:hypothetical protein